MTRPLVGYRRNTPPILKPKSPKVHGIDNRLPPLELPTTPSEKYMGEELQRIENTLKLQQSPEMKVVNFTVTREIDGQTPDLTNTTNTLLTLIQDLKDSGVIS